jgi:hypothetical protein
VRCGRRSRPETSGSARICRWARRPHHRPSEAQDSGKRRAGKA